MPEQSRAEEIAASPLFDAAWYVTRYPDVARVGLDPAKHYAEFGEAEGRDAGPAFSVTLYAQRHPEAVGAGSMLLHAQQHGQGEDGRPAAPRPDAVPAPDVGTLLAERFPKLRPLPAFAIPHEARRLSIVTDGIDPGRLRRGAGSAIIVAALTAQRVGASLRIVTRDNPSDPGNVAGLLDNQGIDWTGNMEFVHAPAADRLPGIPIGPGDRFIVTSWSAARATRLSVPRAHIAYALHEDERLHESIGDDRLRCSEALRDPELLYIAGSESLLRSLQADGLAPGGTALGQFSGSSLDLAASRSPGTADKLRFLLDASPSVPGSFFWRCLEALLDAIDARALDPVMWDFHLASAGPRDVTLPGGIRPAVLDRLGWANYVAERRNMDLRLCLEESPHAGTPDLAPCGGISVMGRAGPGVTQNPRIVRAEPDRASLVTALRDAARRAAERPRGETATAPGTPQANWARSAAPAIDRLARWIEH